MTGWRWTPQGFIDNLPLEGWGPKSIWGNPRQGGAPVGANHASNDNGGGGGGGDDDDDDDDETNQ